MLERIKKLLRPPYHFLLQWGAALYNGFPAQHLVVVGVTGTKGKSTVSDMVYAILTHAGHRVALASTIRYVTPKSESRNMFKMTMRGRGFIQHFLARARRDGATHAVVEISSEGAVQFRHRFLYLDALAVTNIHPEHIESHGSFENYVAAKREIVRELERSTKRPRTLVVSGDNEHTYAFLEAQVEQKQTFHEGPPSDFNGANARAAVLLTSALGVPTATAEEALRTMPQVRGRAEEIHVGQNFTAVVDYAHTAESLEAIYSKYAGRKICVLGNTGGGRDKWKRPKMGAIADEHCDDVILTNEDPYDEDPRTIVDEMARGMKRPPTIIMDRRAAIREALVRARMGDIVLITGKGTDPYIMGAQGEKTPWDDATVVREELQRLLQATH